MDTASFLSHVLPKQGFKFIAIKRGEDKPWIHKPSESTSIAADIAEQADATGAAVYHACASFKQAFIEHPTEKYEDGRPKRKYRVEDNAGWVKSFWLDLDCGEDKDYPDQKSALADIVRFCKESGLPRPLLVNSGNGIHCYWVLDTEIDAVQWKRVAGVLRSVLDHFSVKHDSVCTTDVCRVLRPAGTTNRKRGEKPVAVLGAVPPTLDIRSFAGSLVALVKTHQITVKATAPKRPSFLANANLNSDLTSGTERPPSSAEMIAEHCAQVRDFRASGGNVDEPLWYAMLGLLKHTTEADQVCHEWSSGYSGYDAEKTSAKIIQWVHGPSTCERLSALRPEGCAGCPHNGKVKSPIQLGIFNPENNAPVVEEGEENDAGITADDVPEMPPSLAAKYHWNGSELAAYVKDEDGVQQRHVFSTMYLFPSHYSENRESTVDSSWVLRERAGKFRKFEIPVQAISNGGRDLLSAIGAQGIVAVPGGKKAMENYISEWFIAMRNGGDAVNAYTTFGWQKDGFLLGDTLLMSDGSSKRVRVQGDAEPYVSAFEPTGDLKTWVDGIDRLYNREGHEQFQWMLGTGFGAPLVQLVGGGFAGCVINGYSPETAQGKSTAGKLALSLYGNPEKLALTKQQATTKGLFAYTGVMKSLPILLDEITNTRGFELSDLLYTFSQGTGRIGATSDGGLRRNVYEWATLMAATSNRAAQSTVAAAKANATPEIARIFEYKFTRSVNQMTKLEADDLIPSLMSNCGHAGREYMTYIVSNREKVEETMRKVRILLTKKINLTQEERFWLNGMTCIVAGLTIAKSLGLVNFDLKNLIEWSARQVGVMRALVGETETSPVDQFGTMLNELSSGFLVTDREGDARANDARANVLHAPRGNLVGRVIVNQNVLYLPVSVMRRWCAENQADYREMADALALRQWGAIEPKPTSLGKGTTDYATAPSRCFKINLALAGGELAAATTVTHLRAVK